MKRNHILKVILILISFMLTVGIGRSFIGKSNNCSKENQVVKATIVGENLNTKVDDKSQQLINKSGYIRDYYEKNGEFYVVFDEVEFFRNEEARREYFKDGNVEEPMEEWGNDYYIRNNDNSTKVYKIANDSKLELLSFEIGRDNSIDLISVTPDKIKEIIDKYKYDNSLERALLFNIDENDDIVYGMKSIYTP